VDRDARRAARGLLGVSNVSPLHLRQLAATGAVLPAFVQNRCFARRGWDRDVRAFCHDHSIVYQGFSLLTANPEVLASSLVRRIATRERVTPPQVVFRFALAVGMLPLTGTSDREHMTQDLASPSVTLSPDEVESIESMAG
jgi:diketogulonate reductase-like aldo/keto reductase